MPIAEIIIFAGANKEARVFKRLLHWTLYILNIRADKHINAYTHTHTHIEK